MSKLNSNRKFPGTSNRNRPDKAETRKIEAEARQDVSNEMTPQQRLDRLDMKFGAGKGAAKERKRLIAVLNKTHTKPAVVDVQIETLGTQTLPDEVMQEISSLNEDVSGKKKLKAKDRRARNQNRN